MTEFTVKAGLVSLCPLSLSLNVPIDHFDYLIVASIGFKQLPCVFDGYNIVLNSHYEECWNEDPWGTQL
jgi:hypothetical protein